MQRYQGRIEFWEVVNEPSHLPGLKIDSPYRWAREADPKAVLVVNDYHVMADGQPAFYRLLERADQNGVPFDGIGIQAHEPRTMRFPLARVTRFLDHYGSLGKVLHITEFTPTSAGQPMTGSPRGAPRSHSHPMAHAR
jgi:endo-1,4-beta-xylanase